MHLTIRKGKAAGGGLSLRYQGLQTDRRLKKKSPSDANVNEGDLPGVRIPGIWKSGIAGYAEANATTGIRLVGQIWETSRRVDR